MVVKKKYKKLTNKEKEFNKEIREGWREKGLIPPVKPKLNRKKFAKEVHEEFKESFGTYGDIQYLYEAISWMSSGDGAIIKITPEQIGVLKLLKIAMEIKKFKEQKSKNGEKEYKVMELYKEVVDPILKL